MREDYKPKCIERKQAKDNTCLKKVGEKTCKTCKSRYHKNTGKKNKNCL